MDDLVAAAVIDNARWCDLVCATHGIAGRFDADAWVTALDASPPGYPDGITLVADGSAEALLARIDRSAGCSVKDSFATLDLSAAGFEVLFDAQWIARVTRPASTPPIEPGRLRWERVTTPDELHSWSLAHGGGSTFRPALLDEPSVAILAGHDPDGTLCAGAIATEGDEAVGISNEFVVAVAGDDARDEAAAFSSVFDAAAAAIGERYPDRPIVGYLAGAPLEAARAAGFETIGPLRVWMLGSSRRRARETVPGSSAILPADEDHRHPDWTA